MLGSLLRDVKESQEKEGRESEGSDVSLPRTVPVVGGDTTI